LALDTHRIVGIVLASAHRAHLCGLTIAIALVLAAQVTRAQDSDGDYVHWAYSAYFGTGWYEIADGDSAFAMSFGPRRRLREARLGENGQRQLGVELRLLVSGSVHELDFEDLPGTIGIGNVSALSAVPGIEVEVPINARWSLKPVAHLGWGSELGGGDSAWIYWAGLKSRYELPLTRARVALINSISYVAYTAEAGSAGAIIPFMTGIESEHRAGELSLGGDPLYLRWHAAYTRYFDFEYSDDAVQVFGRTQTDVDDEWELGVALHKGDKPLELGFLKWDQIGLGYRFNSDHTIHGLTITFRALFDR
jgi:hypothetical protein